MIPATRRLHFVIAEDGTIGQNSNIESRVAELAEAYPRANFFAVDIVATTDLQE
jgi:hypothetical protein